ncbi:hypothetical protein D3C75_1318780 [compost metagenome]
MTRTGIVPAVGALFGNTVQALDHFHGPARLQLIEPDAECRAHDAPTNEQDIHFFWLGGVRGRKTHRHRQAQ